MIMYYNYNDSTNLREMQHGSVKTLHQMKIFMTNRCSLHCKHCINFTEFNPPNRYDADIDFIKKQIDFIIDMGVYWIELGILVGDVLECDKKLFYDTIEYLENNDKIKGISFASSFLFLSDLHIDGFNITNKIHCVLSLYGYDKQSFLDTTGIDGYELFKKNLKKLNNVKTKISITVTNMTNATNIEAPYSEHSECSECSEFFDLENLDILTILSNNRNLTIHLDNRPDITNWSEMLNSHKNYNNHDTRKTRKHECMYLYTDTGIDEYGNVLLCAWFDENRFVKLGNIFTDTPEFVKKQHERIISLQRHGVFMGVCENCTVYSSSTNINFSELLLK